MKKVIYIALICATVFVSSCTKDESSPKETSSLTEQTTPNYMPLAIGNYWVYEVYKVDTSGIEELKPIRDSVVITKDSIINGNKYFYLENFGTNQSWDNNKWIRDSADYLIDYEGYLYFSYLNYSDTLAKKYQIIAAQDTICFFYSKMEPLNGIVNVPAGNFQGIDSRTTIIDLAEEPRQKNHRTLSCIYADNVGKILQQIGSYYYPQWVFERRLVDYFVAEDSE